MVFTILPRSRTDEQRSAPPSWFKWTVVAVCFAGFSAVVAAAVWAARPTRVVAGVRVWGEPVGGLTATALKKRLNERVQRFLEQPVTLTWERGTLSASWFNLGIGVDVNPAVRKALAVGHSGNLWRDLSARRAALRGQRVFDPVFSLDTRRAGRFLLSLKEKIDVRPVAGRLDLRKRTVVPGKVGYALRIHMTLARILKAAWSGKNRVELSVKVVRPALSGQHVGALDISKVLGWFETPYKSTGKYAHRTHNLRVAARKLNGQVVMPGETFSVNEALGPRTEREGYRVAPVISRGEMVDGMAGGACQISSTLFAAAYFAGLEVVEADVHSQPSHYIELGLDATVVWPDKDLKIRNPYDFPVVIHCEVNFGRVRTEILGGRRPYRIGFERRILTQRAYREEVRPDPEMDQGKRKIEQRGEFGYTVRRRRIFFDKNGHEVKSQYRTVVYPPTTLIVRLGTRPPADPSVPIPELPPIQPKPVPRRFVRIIR